MPELRITPDAIAAPGVGRFLAQHLEEMLAVTPAGSVHALDGAELQRSGARLWTVRDGEDIVGCSALLAIGDGFGEIKSMRVAGGRRRRGVGTLLLLRLVQEARADGLHTLVLETGSCAFFRPARELYLRHGFTYVGPFAGYTEDPNSVFMARAVSGAGGATP